MRLIYERNEPFDWYVDAVNKGIYKPLTLSEWADEIEWRVKLLISIYQRRRNMMLWDDGYYDNVEDIEKFKSHLLNPSVRFLKLDIGSKLGEAIRLMDTYELEETNEFSYKWKQRGRFYDVINMDEGLVIPCLINLSYDDKTLESELVRIIDEHKRNWISKERGKKAKHRGITRAGKGHTHYTEKNALNWSKWKLLPYIDYCIWAKIIKDFRKTDENISEDIGVGLGTLKDNLKPYYDELMNPYTPSLLRASSKVAAKKIASKNKTEPRKGE